MNGGSKRPTIAKRKHKHLRHQSVEVVSREDRDQAIELIRTRHPQHGRALLRAARAGAVTGMKFDKLMKFVDWCTHLARALDSIPAPPLLEGSISLGQVDARRMTRNARQVHKVLRAQVQIANNLAALSGLEHETELLRDVGLMMGAVVLRYASAHGVTLHPRDFADLAVAVGIEKFADDTRTSSDRWRKRLPRVRQAVPHVRRYHEEDTRDLGDEFFAPLL